LKFEIVEKVEMANWYRHLFLVRLNQQLYSKATPLIKKHYNQYKMAKREFKWLKEEYPDFKLLVRALRERCFHHKPLSYILGNQPFNDITVAVKRPVLIPRWETEEWCSWLHSYLNESHRSNTLRILDLCTGSGCIALYLANQFKNFKITGVDISPHAITLAQLNQRNLQVNNANFHKADLRNTLEISKLGAYDIIVSNPPYIPKNTRLMKGVRSYEDPNALYASDKGLDLIEHVLKIGTRTLNDSNGLKMLVEFDGHNQKAQIKSLVTKYFPHKRLLFHKDSNRRLRYFTVWQ
jgi:HemK-like putative methylase